VHLNFEAAKKEVEIALTESIVKSIEEKRDFSKGKTKAEIRQVLIEYVKEKIGTASIGGTGREASVIFVEETGEGVQLNFQEGMNEEKVSVFTTEQIQKKGHYNDNAIFRIFIWRDMLVDLANEKPMLGFDFGKPFRSKSLEILYWGARDWLRDGWIAAHNSYLHMIYRTGIIGIMLIVALGIILLRMIKGFIARKSLTGVLLCGIIINWFTAANFLLTFELPYTAIPVWAIYGITIAYYCEVQKENSDPLKP